MTIEDRLLPTNGLVGVQGEKVGMTSKPDIYPKVEILLL